MTWAPNSRAPSWCAMTPSPHVIRTRWVKPAAPIRTACCRSTVAWLMSDDVSPSTPRVGPAMTRMCSRGRSKVLGRCRRASSTGDCAAAGVPRAGSRGPPQVSGPPGQHWPETRPASRPGRSGARNDYVAALRLVRGPVLQPQRPGIGWAGRPGRGRWPPRSGGRRGRDRVRATAHSSAARRVSCSASAAVVACSAA